MENLKPLKLKTGLTINTTTKARTPDANMEAEIFRRSSSTPRSPPAKSAKRTRAEALDNDGSLEDPAGEMNSITMEEINVLGDIKNERTALEEFLFNDSNKISKNAIKFILSKWSFLESKLYEDRLEKERIKATYQKRSPTKTYADTVSGPVGPRGPLLQPETEKKKNRLEHEVVLIKPIKDTDKRNNEQIRQDIVKELEGSRNKLRIQRMRQMRNKGMVLEVCNSKDVELIKKTDWTKLGLKTDEPNKLHPSIVIYDVELDYKEEDLKEDLINKNFDFIDQKQKEKLEKNIIFRQRIKADSKVHWVVQLPGTLYECLINRSRIFLMWRTYRIKEFLNIMRCFKCHGYGHMAKNCSQEQICETCGHKDHMKQDCPRKNTPCCVNCIRTRRKDSYHAVKSAGCPEYKRQIELYRCKIKWV